MTTAGGFERQWLVTEWFESARKCGLGDREFVVRTNADREMPSLLGSG